MQGAGVVFQILIQFQERNDLRQIKFSVFIDDHSSGHTVKQRRADGFFQFVDGVGDGRLGHGQRFGRSGDAAFFTHRFKDSKMS